MVMVTKATPAIMEKISEEICPRRSPWVTRIKENSEIWARETAVRKEVLFP